MTRRGDESRVRQAGWRLVMVLRSLGLLLRMPVQWFLESARLVGVQCVETLETLDGLPSIAVELDCGGVLFGENSQAPLCDWPQIGLAQLLSNRPIGLAVEFAFITLATSCMLRLRMSTVAGSSRGSIGISRHCGLNSLHHSIGVDV